MKCSLIRCSKIALSDWSSSRIVEALSVQLPAIFLSERYGSRDIQWLFLDCVGGVYLRKPAEIDCLNQECRSASGISPTDFFRLVDEVAENFSEPIPFISGYMSYEALMHHHRVLSPSRPDGILGWYGLFETIIRISGEEVLEYKLSFTEIGEEWLSKGEKLIRSNYRKAPISRALLRDEIQASLRSENPIQSLTHLLDNIPSASRVPYRERILGIQELIRSGDVYQANLSLHLKVEGALDPVSTAKWLLGGGRAAQMAMMSFDKRIIASGSPELFLREEETKLVSAPIKGTRPRLGSDEENVRAIEELKNSTKDRAELAMIVDLVRNDLNRVCEPGTVVVENHGMIEAHPSVYHTVSTISGRRSGNTTTADVWDSLFPAGSITGAPKIAAMRAIAQSESHWRDCYCGAIGYFGGGRSNHHNVAIRTISSEEGVVSLWAGGGITIDSDPDQEYQECLWKLMPSLQIVTAA